MKKVLKIATRFLLFLMSFVLVFVSTYVIYMNIQFFRIDDELNLEILDNQTAILDVSKDYSIITYNIGFGAYNHEFSFFMDSGENLDGTKVYGTMSKAESKEVVLKNTHGAIYSVKVHDPDFVFFQEVDIKSTRSHKVNQYETILDSFNKYGSIFAYNFHSAYLLYPFNDFHGSVKSGIATFSKYNIHDATRYQLPIDESFPAKFFDLDRAFTISRIPTSNSRDLYLINVHLSAYDEGGLIRAKQLETLNKILVSLKNEYVIVGGDFNHDIADSLNKFATMQKVPSWVYKLSEENLPDGYRFATNDNVGTCRSTDMAYIKGFNYTVVIDGFIVSDNIQTILVENLDLNFEHSDHNPVKLVFKLQ